MAKVNYSDGLSRTNVLKYPFRGVSPSNTSRQTEDFQKKVAEEVAQMGRNELAVDVSKDFDGVDLQDHIIREPDDSQLLTVEPPLTLSKIYSKLTAVERLWVARVVKAHGKEVVLARWPAYEVHINYVRYLR
ncbi:MAG: hypothetical protein KF722_16805 [Nitrospira sp.]|nr:hypothetical protein [Nitrospira sp.]